MPNLTFPKEEMFQVHLYPHPSGTEICSKVGSLFKQIDFGRKVIGLRASTVRKFKKSKAKGGEEISV